MTNLPMEILDVAELKERFEEILQQVEAGKVFGISKEGRLVARIEPADDNAQKREIDEYQIGTY